METLRIGLGSSSLRQSFGQSGLGGRVLAIGRRHLTIPPPRPTRSFKSPSVLDTHNGRLYHSHRPLIRYRSSLSQYATLNRRHNSSNVPSKPTQIEKPTTSTSTTPSDPSQTASPAPSTSLLSRFTGLVSLRGSQTSGETGYSSVAKLVELAKPEKKQLAMAVGLVSCVAGM